MRKLNDLTFGLIGAGVFAWQGKRGPASLAEVIPLAWVSKPATSGVIGDTLTASWKGSNVPFTAVVTNPAGATVATQSSNATSISYTTKDGTDAAGQYTVTVTDATGAKVTASTAMVAVMSWATQPAATGVIGGNVTASWKDGKSPYTATIKNPAGATVASLSSTATSISYATADGTDAAGDYTVTVTDDTGKTLTGKTTMAAALKFTAQPQSVAMYQQGGLLSITGAAVQGATSLQWQKQNGTDWADVAGRTAASISASNADATWPGIYRLKATNGISTVYSNNVKVGNLYLAIFADLNGNAGADAVTQDTDKFNYKGALLSGQHYYTARLYDTATGAAIVPADWGLTASRAVATWTTSNAAVSPITSVASNGQLLTAPASVTAGTSATLTAKYGNLTSNLKLTAATA